MMTAEVKLSPEEEKRKEAWLESLGNFVVKANSVTWAGEGKEVPSQRPGYKELEYEEGDWLLRDSYAGYYRAPGMTTVYYKGLNNPAWTVQYGGHGQTEEFYGHAKETFKFLKAALRGMIPELPIRGPQEYVEGNKKYTFEVIEGDDITDLSWQERITEDGILTFTQKGTVGIVISRDSNRQPVYPWNL